MDKLFRISTIRQTPQPQNLIWLAAHQDYSENMVTEELDNPSDYPNTFKSEKEAGEAIIQMLLKGNKGHFGPAEHPQITINAGYFPHSVIAQITRHRVGVTFDVQSMRYTSQRFVDAVENDKLDKELERLIYFRPVGQYLDRNGTRIDYTAEIRNDDKRHAYRSIMSYVARLKQGFPPEQARGMLPYDYRQHFMMSTNLRSAFHILDLRSKKDAQLEIQWFCELFFKRLMKWCPELTGWYEQNRLNRARLAP